MTITAINKLGLTEEERICFYYNADNKKFAAEVRQFDPVNGLLVLYNSADNLTIDFLWNSIEEKWAGIGETAGYVAEFSVEGETPITKVNAADRGVQTLGYPEPAEKATTITRFPS